MKKIFILFSSISLLLGLAILSILWSFSNKLPDYKFLKNYKPAVSSRVYAGDGQLIAEFSTQKRLFVPYNAIPKKVLYSFLSAEDKNFFTHPGIDAKGVLRAVIKNFKNIFSKVLQKFSINSGVRFKDNFRKPP